MRYARWNESLETGDPEVDGQHRALYDLVNDLNVSALLGVGHDGEREALQRILGYTTRHFVSEEALMRRFAYPGVGEHSAVHTDFTGAARGLVAEHASGKGPNIRELAEFMEHWLELHIASFDQPMVAHVRACRLRVQGI